MKSANIISTVAGGVLSLSSASIVSGVISNESIFISGATKVVSTECFFLQADTATAQIN